MPHSRALSFFHGFVQPRFFLLPRTHKRLASPPSPHPRVCEKVLHIVGSEVGRAFQIAVQREGQSVPHAVTVVTESDLPRPANDEKSGADSSSAPEEAPASGGGGQEERSDQAAGEDVTGA